MPTTRATDQWVISLKNAKTDLLIVTLDTWLAHCLLVLASKHLKRLSRANF